MQKSLAIHDAYKRGDLETLKTLLENPPNFPNCQAPPGFGEIILEYAIYHSPFSFIRKLLELGADPNYGEHAGFPSLIATLSCSDRPDRYEILELLLFFGADIQQHGHNDYTPLHYAASIQDIQAMELLLAHGADLNARTRIDDYATPLEEMEILGNEQSAAFLRKAANRKT
jgi:ankyrin repeat protein